jgi:NAD(P)-dependent dehydrogenase (short-subunit alcohol dehydrogenase family)
VRRTALITGSASGIGRAVALRLALEGALVVAADCDDAGNAALAAEAEQAGLHVETQHLDVTGEDEVRQLITGILERHRRLDLACNSAGIVGAQLPLVSTGLADWQRVLDVDLTGLFLCLREEVRAMAQAGSGSIVNVASVASLVGSRGMSAYAAAKHGVLGLTRVAAREAIAHDVRVNAVAPGLTDTPMVRQELNHNPEWGAESLMAHPIGRPAKPEEIAAAVSWLLSPNASYVVGACLTVDGGFTIGGV